MAGHKGYGATSRGGRIPKGKPMDIGFAPGFSRIAELAIEVRRAADQLGMDPAEVLARMRKDDVIDCDDVAAEAAIELCRR